MRSHAQSHVLRHRSRDRRGGRFRRPHRAQARSSDRPRSVGTFAGYDRDAKRFLIEPVFEVHHVQHRRADCSEVAAEFLSRSFGPRRDDCDRPSPRFPSHHRPANRRRSSVRFSLGIWAGWLMRTPAGANVYVAANPLISGSRKRTKESIAEVRHLYLDLDTDAECQTHSFEIFRIWFRLRPQSSQHPPANTRCFGGWKSIPLRAAGKRCSSCWRSHFGGDPACTDCNRVLRLPGFLNQKYDPAHLVGVEYASDSTVASQRLSARYSDPKGELIRGGIRSGKPTGKHSHSEQDWAWILQELARGKDPVKLTRTLAERRSDKSNPLYYAQRTVDVASAWLWLKRGFPIADVVTMLQVRRRFEIPR